MWVAKIKILDDKCIWATRCKKFNLHVYQYPLGYYETKQGFNFIVYHILEGDEKNIRKYIRDVKKAKRVKRIDVQENVMISLVIEGRGKKELEAFKTFYNKKLIYLKPGINDPSGHEVWEVGSFDRKDVEKMIKYAERYYHGELLFLRETKVPKIFLRELMPELTDKHSKAFKTAVKSGYYEFPRKTNLHKLAKMSKISRPTFEEHLRKAENRMLKFMRELFLK